MSNYLVHHGILGQKWGKKNGPPYPLDYKKLSSEERALAKRSAIDRGDTMEAIKNVDYYSNSEIQELLNRVDMKQKLANISKKDVKTGRDRVKDIASTMGTMSDAISKGSSLYNSIAKVANAFGDSDLPIIGEAKKNNDVVKPKTTKISDFEKYMKDPDKYTDEQAKEISNRMATENEIRKQYNKLRMSSDGDKKKKKVD